MQKMSGIGILSKLRALISEKFLRNSMRKKENTMIVRNYMNVRQNRKILEYFNKSVIEGPFQFKVALFKVEGSFFRAGVH